MGQIVFIEYLANNLVTWHFIEQIIHIIIQILSAALGGGLEMVICSYSSMITMASTVTLMKTKKQK